MANSIYEEFLERGLTRRDFLSFCALMAGTLALPWDAVAEIEKALKSSRRLPLLWLEFQSCTADTESFLRASNPSASQLVLDVLAVNYSETLMAAAGQQAEEVLWDTVEKEKGKYVAVVEGSIPTAEGGIYCTIGGETAVERTRRICKDASAVICVGTCACFGGIPMAAPNPTGAKSVEKIVPGIKSLLNLPACPVNVVNVSASLVHLLTFGRLPAKDGLHRPLFAYGKRIHDDCERRASYDAGRFVEKWGDEGHRKGWCLYKMGCKGPATFHNCPRVRWNSGTSWPIGSGHPCIGCSEPNFWDSMSPFYKHLPKVPGFGVETTVDKVGVGLVAATVAIFLLHGFGSWIREQVIQRREHRKGDESSQG